MTPDAPAVLPKTVSPGRYECPLAPGVICRPYLGRRDYRVVDECSCPSCALWQARHNNPWDGFGQSCGYRPDDRPRRDDAPRLTVEAVA